MKLRQYQESFVTGLAQCLSKHRKILGQLATGGGKTIVFASIANRYIKKTNKRVLILVHRTELLEQTRKAAYNAYGLTCQPIVAGMKYIPDADIYVGMVESVNRRISKLPDIGLVIIDECHIASFNKMHDHFPDQYIIGFTATPLSSQKRKPLKMFYDEIVCGVDIPQLISEGHLCQNITWAPKETVDRLSLAVKGEEFDETLMGLTFSKPKYISNTVSAYEKWAKGTKTIIFNVNVNHSKEVALAFNSMGYECMHLDGEMDKVERKKILDWFKVTPNAILCNIGIATTGFDEPTIETVIVNKATMSMPLWLQMCGRGGRTLESKSAFTIIDMGGNAITHGDWCQSRDWTRLFHEPPKPGKKSTAPVKSCPACDAIIPASVRICPYCGYEFASKDIPVEVDLHEFIVVTKGIDVATIIKENAHRKQYYPFFKIGSDLADEAHKTIPKMCNEYATFILQKYIDLAREWTKAEGKKLSQWQKEKAESHLWEKLKKHFPTWDPPELGTFKRSEAQLDYFAMKGIGNIKDLK